MATSSQNNSFVKDGKLYIVPTLTADNIGMNAVLDGAIYNITDCTFNITRPDNGYITQNGERVFDWASYYRSCSAVSNATAGTVINPVQSARLTTQNSASIRYGRVEIKAKMPNGCVISCLRVSSGYVFMISSFGVSLKHSDWVSAQSLNLYRTYQ